MPVYEDICLQHLAGARSGAELARSVSDRRIRAWIIASVDAESAPIDMLHGAADSFPGRRPSRAPSTLDGRQDDASSAG